jgi:ubiquinone/menaquinone biosynthesis C-methylase UbiE
MTTRYTHGHHESVLASHRWRTAANSAAYLLPSIAPYHTILDVGCGPGTITLDLAHVASRGHVVGVDSAAGAISAAGEAAARAGRTNVRFECGDVMALPYDDGSFDVVHAHQVLQHLADPVAALGEMRRVCRPGGVVAARDADYAAMSWAPADPRLDRWRQVYRRVALENGAQPDAARHLLGWAHAAGFDEVVPSAGVWCFATPTGGVPPGHVGSRSPTSPNRWSVGASPSGRSWLTSPPRGGPGWPTPTAGSASFTERSSAGREGRTGDLGT